MGRLVIFMAGAVIVGASILIFNGQRSAFEMQEQQSAYQFQGIANDIVKSGFNQGVSAIKRDLMNVSGTFSRVEMDDGHYDLYVTKNLYGDLDLNVGARSGDAVYDMEGNVIFTAPLPGVVLLEDEDVDVSWSGRYQVSGIDRRMSARGAGGGLQNPIPALMTTYSKKGAALNSVQMNRLVGEGSSPENPADVSSAIGGFSEDYVEALYQEARLNATHTAAAGMSGLVPQGQVVSAAASSSPGNPVIIRAMGDLNLTGSLRGYGMLMVDDGNLIVSAPDFDWEGLILVRKHHKDTVSVSLRNTTLYGGLIAYDFDPATSLPECVPGFELVDDEVVVSDSFTVRFKVLGAAITAGGAYDMPVTLRIHMGDQVYDPWGDYTLPLDGNINTGNSGVTYSWEPDTVFPAGTNIRVDARSWMKGDGLDGTQNSHWNVYMEMNSQASSQQLELLQNGSPVPSVGGFMGQYSVEEFLGDYIEDDRMKLSLNQASNLFELGMTDPSSAAFDMQDAVVLVTMVKAGVSVCEGGASSSRLQFAIGDNTKIHYSSEAVAKLGLHLNTIRNNTSVRVTRSAVKGRGKGETPVFTQSLVADDHEGDDPSGTSGTMGVEVSVCHKPKMNGGTSTSISKKTLGKHIAHGDYVGACIGWDPDS
ncbi:MAG: hypothetical protein ACE5G0_07950 [Rhodothermales bacterium]